MRPWDGNVQDRILGFQDLKSQQCTSGALECTDAIEGLIVDGRLIGLSGSMA